MKKIDILLHSGDPLEQVVRQSVTSMLGSPEIYHVTPENSDFDLTYLNVNQSYGQDNIPLIMVKALRVYMQNENINYIDLIDRLTTIFYECLESYDFDISEEKIEQDIQSGLLKTSHGNYNDLKLDRLIKSGASGLKRWRVIAGDYSLMFESMIPYNFFTYMFEKLFNVNMQLRKHIIDTLPSISYPSFMLESYIYLRTFRMPNQHYDKTCDQAIEKYNRSLQDVDPDTDFLLQTYPITKDEHVDDVLDRKARIHEPYEIMLLLFLSFSASCKNDEIIWDVMPYYKMYGIIKNIMSFKREDGSIIAGRIISENFYEDMRRAVFIQIQSTAHKTQSVQITSSVFTGLDIVKPSNNDIFTAVNTEIVNLMASGLPSKMWSEGNDLPASWLALL